MSRKGNKLLLIPSGVSVTINPHLVICKSSHGELKVNVPSVIQVTQTGQHLKVTRSNDEKQSRMYHGTVNSNLHNALIGLSQGFSKRLKIVGVGYKAAVNNNQLTLAIGYSHPVVFTIPHGIKLTCPTPTEIVINGYDKIIVGELAAKIREVRKPEPYNGKGIMYSDEIIIRKVGKTAEGATAPAAPAAKK
ncbi:MAG: 50S ribosomal protein L6 [Mycoplasmataceae bacterium]|jgi:large subunit ribosomal protein L6|nr:50S ribosomal protein L6 [Mycoplasmataceae bacterium]